jgi:hypothetical protein
MVRSDPNTSTLHQGLGVRFRNAGREKKGIGERTCRMFVAGARRRQDGRPTKDLAAAARLVVAARK